MINLPQKTIRAMLEHSAQHYGDRVALRFVQDKGQKITYIQLLSQAKAVAAFLLEQGFCKGDKIALLSENMPNWGVFYFGIVLMGGVVVPILPDFTSKEIENILEHSEAKGIGVSVKLYEKCYGLLQQNQILVRIEDLQKLETATDIKSFKTVQGVDLLHQKPLDDSALPAAQEDDLLCIIYTSGTTGQSKGVMLTQRNIIENAQATVDPFIVLNPGDRVLSILPLSHTYEFTIGFILMVLTGCEIYYLGKPPVVSLLLPALKSVKPQIMLSVPLLIEKIYKSAVIGKIRKKRVLSALYKIPFLRKLMNKKIGATLYETFGGHLKFFGIGGAPLDPEVDRFLDEAKFPFSIGYGLTETSPLIAGAAPGATKLGSTGYVLDMLELRIVKDEETEEFGEIQVRGPSVMLGYYKNEELTKEVLSDDGWFSTGDLGYMDKTGRLYLKGRKKNIILGPSGENIFPEMIESLINNFDFVEESLVIPEVDGLSAMIRIDLESFAKHAKITIEQAQEEVKEYLSHLRNKVNKELNSFSRIHTVKEQKEPFIRTPTKKIKRYLYMHHNKKNK